MGSTSACTGSRTIALASKAGFAGGCSRGAAGACASALAATAPSRNANETDDRAPDMNPPVAGPRGGPLIRNYEARDPLFPRGAPLAGVHRRLAEKWPGKFPAGSADRCNQSTERLRRRPAPPRL